MSLLSIVPLSTIQDEVLIKDMNYEFHYKRIVRPDNSKSNLFNLNYKKSSMDNWLTCNGCLSQSFTIIKTEEVLSQINEKLGGRITKKSHFTYGTSVRVILVITDFNLDLPQDSDADKLIFKLLTGVTVDISVLSNAKLTLNITNGFSGNRRLILNYGFLKTIEFGDSKQVITSNNLFLLDKYSKSLLHDLKNIELSYTEISEVESQVQNKILLFKEIPLHDQWLSDLYDKLPRKFSTVLKSITDTVPVNFKNLYYFSFIIGFLLNNIKNFTLETNLKNYIAKYVVAYLKSKGN